MALQKQTDGGLIYLSVSGGSLIRQMREATTESISRVNKVGRTVHEEHYRNVTGMLTFIEEKENDYGKQLLITLIDEDIRYVLTTPFSSRYSSSFLKVVPNLKTEQPVKIMPWETNDKQDPSKKITGITVYQETDKLGWVKIGPAFTKDVPNGLPPMKKIKLKGKEVWDDTDMMAFLIEGAKKIINQTTDAAAGEEQPF